MTRWLRAAVGFAALFAAGHTLGRPWVVGHSASAQAVVGAMQAVHFDALGASRSYWDFYQGFGLDIAALLAVQAVLLWQCATLAGSGRIPLRPLLWTQFAGYVAGAVVAARYIMLVPAILAAAVALCIGIALLRPVPPSAPVRPQ